MEPILINNGKSPNEPHNARLDFWLPVDSPYGNFQLKLFKLSQRIDEANRRVGESWIFWEHSRIQEITNAYERHIYASEQAVYLLRRAADEIIALIWCLAEWERKQSYPQVIKIDCIGAVLKQRQEEQPPPCRTHIQLLTALNEVSNAFKHSFVQSDITLVGRDEPCVHALSLAYNRLDSGVRFHSFSLTWIAKSFTGFYEEAMNWLRAFSERHRPQPSS